MHWSAEFQTKLYELRINRPTCLPQCTTPILHSAKYKSSKGNLTEFSMNVIQQKYFFILTHARNFKCHKTICLLTIQNLLYLQYNTIQYNTIQYSTVQYSTVQYSTVQYSTVQYSTVQYSTVQYSTVQYSTVQYSTVQYSTVNTTQCNTIHYNVILTLLTI